MLRVVALYESAISVVRGLWILFGIIYTISTVLAVFVIKSFYSQCIPSGISETSQRATENVVYDPVSRICLAATGYKPYVLFSIPLAFDVVIIVLTTFKTYRLAATVRKESGTKIVCTSLQCILHAF